MEDLEKNYWEDVSSLSGELLEKYNVSLNYGVYRHRQFFKGLIVV